MNVEPELSLMRSLDTLTSLAYQFGPFFFAVMFSVFITKSAQGCYSAAAANTDEKSTYRRYFCVTYSFAIVLVLLSVGWFFYTQFGKHHALEGVIINLSENQYVDIQPEEFLIRETRETKVAEAPLKQFYFVVIRNRPSRKGDVVLINFWENIRTGGAGEPPKPELLEVQVEYPECFPQKFSISRSASGVSLNPLRCTS